VGQVEGKCSYHNTILPVVIMVRDSKIVQRLVCNRFRVNGIDERAYRQWIKRTRQMYGLSMTNVLNRSFYVSKRLHMNKQG
jgi:hypothetical protein